MRPLSLFARRGVDAVSLRDIAAAADVHLALIGRYIGSRDELVRAVFDDLSDQLASTVLEHPLSGQGFEADTVMGKWVRMAAALAIAASRSWVAAGSTRCLRWPRRSSRAMGLIPGGACCARRRSSLRRWAGGSSRTIS